MPVTDFSVHQNILFARGIGKITADDARSWMEQAAACAQASDYPLVASIDAVECTGITAQARALFAEACHIERLYCTVIAARHFTAMQNIRLLQLMAPPRRIHLFCTMQEGRRFAEQQARLLRSAGEVRTG